MMSEAGGQPQTAADKAKQDALYEDREPKKIIRIITVMAYMCSVSFVGVTLSAYYIFLWHPPNPRLMHQQVHSSHHEARVASGHEYLHQSMDYTTVKAVDPNVLDLFRHANPGEETIKTRREIVKNVNAILSANFEKVKFTETSSSSTTEGTKVAKIEDENIDTSSTTKATEDLSIANDNFSSVSPDENEKSNNDTSEESITDDKTTTVTASSTETPALRRTKIPGKKPHQTPFALKHLEVPIKLEPTRRRLIRFSTTTTTATSKSDTSNVPDTTTEGTLSDTPAAAIGLPASTPDSSEVFDNSSPRHVAKSLYKMLTSPPPNLRDIDYSSSTDLPQIFPAVPRANNNDNDDYHDATIAPVDDILDD